MAGSFSLGGRVGARTACLRRCPIGPLKDLSDHLKNPSDHLKNPSDHLKNPSDHLKDPSDHLKDPSDHLKDLLPRRTGGIGGGLRRMPPNGGILPRSTSGGPPRRTGGQRGRLASPYLRLNKYSNCFKSPVISSRKLIKSMSLEASKDRVSVPCRYRTAA